MKVYVIMGNDYPDAVFEDEAEAAAYVKAKKDNPENHPGYNATRIYWRAYPFKLRRKQS